MKISLNAQFPRRILLIMASILVLSMLMPLSLCADQNNSTSTLSGLVFNDVNGNGERAFSGEDRLNNWTVYVDLNRNFKQDDGDLFNQTDSNGHYAIANIPNGTYQVGEVVKDGWAQTTPNPDDIKFSGSDKQELNFGNYEYRAASITQTYKKDLFNISLWGAVICFIIGIILLVLGLNGFNLKGGEKDLGKMGMILAGVILIILGAYLIRNMEKISGIYAPSISSQFSSIPMWLMAMIFVLLFVVLLAIGICKPEQMEGGQMRRAIAGMLVFGFITVLMFVLYGKEITNNNKEVISQYIQLVGIIIGFYFGAKITTDATGKMSAQYDPTKTKEVLVEIGMPSLTTDGSKIQIPLINKSGQKIPLARIDLIGPHLNVSEPHTESLEKETKITVDLKGGKTDEKYTIFVWLLDGTKVEKEVLPNLS
jgi:hypothetical protein